ncbi:MAG: HAD family hydrolase [bacterium]
MIKLIVLDVDGILIGTKQGYNRPFPSPKVIKYLKELQDKGIPISLCTGKASFATKLLAEKADLNNFHITDAGSLLMDMLTNKVLKIHQISSEKIIELINLTEKYQVFWELFTAENWYIDAKSTSRFIQLHQDSSNITDPIRVADLREVAKKEILSKAMIFCGPDEVATFKKIFSNFEQDFNFQWATTPSFEPDQLLLITAPGVNKRSAIKELCDYYKITPDEVLGVGDTKMDWNFMAVCKYTATVANASDEMKKLVTDHDGYVGPHVDADGIIEILEHFQNEFIF